MNMPRRLMLLGSLAVLAIGVTACTRTPDGWRFRWRSSPRRYSVEDRLQQYGSRVQARLTPAFAAAQLPYPANRLAYVAFKDTRTLEVYARMSDEEPWRFVKQYSILAASGRFGPKLQEGDRQVPEGIYGIDLLNPNSRFHLSVRIDYPNAFDRQMAAAEGRMQLGGDIMIHGDAVSVGCLAMGDEAAEELFVLTALASKENVSVVISPTDFRTGAMIEPATHPAWTLDLYHTIREELAQFIKQA